MTAKNKNIEKNKEYINNIFVNLNDVILTREESILDAIIQKCQEEVESPVKFEKTLSNPDLIKIVGALTLNERKVLFYLYKKDKTIKEITEIMHMDRKTIRRMRDKAQSEIAEKLIKGEF